MKIVELGKFLKTENLTEIVSEFCVGRALMSVQPRSYANSNTFSCQISGYFLFLKVSLVRCVANCKPGKPGLTSFSETLALFFIRFLSFRKTKVQDGQNGPLCLPEETGWLRAC